MSRLLVVSHPSVVSLNQRVYARLRHMGWDVTLVVPARWRHEYDPEPFVPVPLPDLDGRMLRVRVALAGRPARHFYLGRLSRLIRTLAPDVSFVEEETFAASAFQWGWMLRRHNVPFGVQADENLNRTLPAPVLGMRSWVLRHAAFVAVRSPTAAKLVRSWGGQVPLPLVPHAVPLWELPPRRRRDVFTIGYAGRLVPEKGVSDLAAAVAGVRGPVRLLIVGDGPLRQELLRTRLANGEIEIRSDIAHTAMPSAYAEMDVLVLPSRTTVNWAEQFGRVLVEALQCGVPVVGSNSGEIPWVIESTGGGLVYPEGNVDALIGILERFRANPQERAAYARIGRHAVGALFGEESAARALSAALREATSTPIAE